LGKVTNQEIIMLLEKIAAGKKQHNNKEEA